MSLLINITDSSNATDDVFLPCKDQQEGVIFWAFVTFVSFVFGVPGAVAVLLDIFQKGRKGTPLSPIDVFNLNLSIMDGVYLLFLHPEAYNFLYWKNIIYEKLSSFLFSFTLCGRPLLMTCMCLDCYLAVVHPVTYRARKSLTPRVLVAAGVWIVTLAYGCYFSTRQVLVLTDLSPVLFLALTFPVNIFCDIFIFPALKTSNPGGGDVHPQKKKVLQIITSNIIVSCTAYCPLIAVSVMSQIVFVSQVLGHEQRNSILCLVVIPVISITVIGNTVSPYLHLNNIGKLEWLKCWKQNRANDKNTVLPL